MAIIVTSVIDITIRSVIVPSSIIVLRVPWGHRARGHRASSGAR
jgi:hypothetical protein